MGYLHKIYAPVGSETMGEDMFQICQTYQIPFLVIVPENHYACAQKKFDFVPEIVEFVDPDNLLDRARDIIGQL